MEISSAPKFLFLFLFTAILTFYFTGVISSRELVPMAVQHDFVTIAPVTVSPALPTSNPAAPVTNPAVAPPAAPNAPAFAGRSWCVAKTGAPEKSLQSALDYACGVGKADCSGIQHGAGCYNPNTLQHHASYAFNSYYQRNPVRASCDFGGTAVVTITNPSFGSCVFLTSSSSTSPTTASPITTPTTPTLTPTISTPTPTTQSPIPATPSPTLTIPTPTPTISSPTPATPTISSPTPTSPTLTPTTASPTPATLSPTPTASSSSGAAMTGSSGTPPIILNANNPALGGAMTGFGESSPTLNSTSSVSLSSSLQPYIGSILVVASIITGGMVLDV